MSQIFYVSPWRHAVWVLINGGILSSWRKPKRAGRITSTKATLPKMDLTYSHWDLNLVVHRDARSVGTWELQWIEICCINMLGSIHF